MTHTIAHFSDLHLGPVHGFTPRHWNLKRVLGYWNWHRKRQYIHRAEIIDTLLNDLAATKPDHTVITGDLVNIGLPREYEQARDWLQRFGASDDVSLIPGNHDIYTRLWTDEGVDRWAPYMSGECIGPHAFPYVRRLGPITIIGLNSAVPTPPAFATGLLGWRQMRDLRRRLAQEAKAGQFRLVLIHHPPVPGLADYRRRLRDAHALADVLSDTGAELVLYGHNHRNLVSFHKGPASDIPLVGIASASQAIDYGGAGLGRYNLYRITPVDDAWQIDLTGRGLKDANGKIGDVETRSFRVPRAHA